MNSIFCRWKCFGGESANELQNNSKGPCEETGARVSTATLKWVWCHHGLRGCSARSPILQGNAGQRQNPSVLFCFFTIEKLHVMHQVLAVKGRLKSTSTAVKQHHVVGVRCCNWSWSISQSRRHQDGNYWIVKEYLKTGCKAGGKKCFKQTIVKDVKAKYCLLENKLGWLSSRFDLNLIWYAGRNEKKKKKKWMWPPVLSERLDHSSRSF